MARLAHPNFYRVKAQERKNNAFVIGLPGLVHESEPSRIEGILDQLSKEHKIPGVRVNYSQVRFDEATKTIICDFDLLGFRQDIQNSLKVAGQEGIINRETKIGFITNSISAGIFVFYLSRNHGAINRIEAIASISPLPGWAQSYDEKTRNRLDLWRDLEISTKQDKQMGITRKITCSSLPQVMGFDGIKLLEEMDIPRKKGIKALTMIGNYDTISSPKGMELYHKRLTGDIKGIRKYGLHHELSPAQSQETVDFLAETLNHSKGK